jgi:hypothetical protein
MKLDFKILIQVDFWDGIKPVRGSDPEVSGRRDGEFGRICAEWPLAGGAGWTISLLAFSG